ncbi:hypothetical protein PsalMR5_02671 [Piscirickettsia salmonis]|uniref:hypothetical protein n=1 Tax=Piscirickettsia salmonis TaxID=1238 RepID=UPI0012BA6931|nr:hypothetical protein [Piscirickettsia salmonis]QGP55226.1 hypothetical protein PsalSR1_02670 [Piscirickettsia salmonis]QGP58918.1 hypothetical protein PsalBI1_01500 [Piscirickettsia salmonis]QGP64792.1 hypothetical protein PsalMR5_02671 [Piscirickettsia salmonis]
MPTIKQTTANIDPQAHPTSSAEQQNNNIPPPLSTADSNTTASGLSLQQIQTKSASETVKNSGDSITLDQLLNLIKQEIQKAIFVIDKKIKNAILPFSTSFEDTSGRKTSIQVLEELIKDTLTHPSQGNSDQPLTQELGELVHGRIKNFYEDDGKMKGRRKTKTISMLFSEIKLMFQNITYANAAVSDNDDNLFPPPPPPLLEQDLLSLELTQFSDSELPLPPPPSPTLLENQERLEINAAQPGLSTSSRMAYMALLGARLREKQQALSNTSHPQPAPPLPPKPTFSADDLAPPSTNHKINSTNPSPTPPPLPPREQELLNLDLTQFSDSELPLPPPPSPALLEDQQQLELTVAQPDLSADSSAELGAKPQESQHPLANNNNSQPPPPLPPKPVFLADDLAPPNSGNAKPPLPPKPLLTADDLTSSESAHAQCISNPTTNKTMTFLEEIQQRKQQGLRNIEHSHPLQQPASLDLDAQILRRRQDMQPTGKGDDQPANLTAALLFQCSQMNIQRRQSNSSNGTNDNNGNWSDDWSDSASSPPSP